MYVPITKNLVLMLCTKRPTKSYHYQFSSLNIYSDWLCSANRPFTSSISLMFCSSALVNSGQAMSETAAAASVMAQNETRLLGLASCSSGSSGTGLRRLIHRRGSRTRRQSPIAVPSIVSHYTILSYVWLKQQ